MGKKRGAGEGSIYQTSDGRWRGAITVGYKRNSKGGIARLRKVLSGRTRADVAEQMKKALRDQQQGANITPERVTLGAHLDRWLTDVVKPTCSFKTHRTYSDLVEQHVKPALGSVLLAKVTTPQIQHLLNEKDRVGLSPKTVKHIRDCLRAALNVAVNDWEIIARNPASRAKPPDPEKTELRVFDVPQARKFLDLVAGHRLEALFSVALCLGPRQGEVLGLQWSNVDLVRRELKIDGALKRIEGKLVKGKTKRETSNRTIALPALTVAALFRHQERQNREREWAGDRWKETGYVFTTRIGTPIERRNLLRDWYKIMRLSGLPKIRFHDLRHSAATLLFAQGVHPKTVMEILGHSDLNTTMKIYGHVLDQMKREAASKMDELFSVATSLATGKAQTVAVN
jgi:integrase